MPSARDKIAAPAKLVLKRRRRMPNFRSCHSVSTTDSQVAAHTCSFTLSAPPISMRAARTASWRLIPRRIFSFTAESKSPRSSSSISRSTCSLRNSPRKPAPRFRNKDIAALLRLCLENSRDGRRLPGPFASLTFELFPSQRRQQVILRAPVVFRVPPFALEPAGPLQPAECRKQRSRIHLEDALADLLDAHGYPIAVHGFQFQRFQDQHVQRALDETARLVRHKARSSRLSRGRWQHYPRLSRGALLLGVNMRFHPFRGTIGPCQPARQESCGLKIIMPA